MKMKKMTMRTILAAGFAVGSLLIGLPMAHATTENVVGQVDSSLYRPGTDSVVTGSYSTPASINMGSRGVGFEQAPQPWLMAPCINQGGTEYCWRSPERVS